MIILPYSTALTLARPAHVSYLVALVCALMFTLQVSLPITEALVYHPESLNPLKMISSSLVHGSFLHLLFNLIFFLAFAPALEVLLSNSLRFVAIMLIVAIFVSICYSIVVFLGGVAPLPTLGFSGVVMGMIGLSAYLMPQARIRVFCWFIVFWKTIYVRAWILAVIYIGIDAWTIFTSDDYGGVNLVAHVAGGVAGYLIGLGWLSERREETSAELEEEIEAMQIEQRYGRTRAEAHRYKKKIDPIIEQRERQRAHDKFLAGIYQQVKTHRDGAAVVELLERYGSTAVYTELEEVFDRIVEWGPSRTALCFGRLIIHTLEREQRHGRVLLIIEQCQAISPQFVLPDISRTLFYAQMALETGKPLIAQNLLIDAKKRYRNMINAEQANHLYQQAARM